MESSSLNVPGGIAAAETNEAKVLEDATTAYWPAPRTAMPPAFVMPMFPASTWPYMDLPTMVNMNSVPRTPMVAFGVNSLNACLFCWPINPVAKRIPPLSIEKRILLFRICLAS
jgi:hypothetical protein